MPLIAVDGSPFNSVAVGLRWYSAAEHTSIDKAKKTSAKSAGRVIFEVENTDEELFNDGNSKLKGFQLGVTSENEVIGYKSLAQIVALSYRSSSVRLIIPVYQKNIDAHLCWYISVYDGEVNPDSDVIGSLSDLLGKIAASESLTGDEQAIPLYIEDNLLESHIDSIKTSLNLQPASKLESNHFDNAAAESCSVIKKSTNATKIMPVILGIFAVGAICLLFWPKKPIEPVKVLPKTVMMSQEKLAELYKEQEKQSLKLLGNQPKVDLALLMVSEFVSSQTFYVHGWNINSMSVQPEINGESAKLFITISYSRQKGFVNHAIEILKERGYLIQLNETGEIVNASKLIGEVATSKLIFDELTAFKRNDEIITDTLSYCQQKKLTPCQFGKAEDVPRHPSVVITESNFTNNGKYLIPLKTLQYSVGGVRGTNIEQLSNLLSRVNNRGFETIKINGANERNFQFDITGKFYVKNSD